MKSKGGASGTERGTLEVHGSFTPSNELPLWANGSELECRFKLPGVIMIKRKEVGRGSILDKHNFCVGVHRAYSGTVLPASF